MWIRFSLFFCPPFSLIALRHNIGRLLTFHVPALDLNQVNYETNVIDEILEQYLDNQESAELAAILDGEINT